MYEAAATALLVTLPEDQREQVVAAAIDMSAAYANSIQVQLPQAEIVHDRFHITKHLNEAVDQVRRSEHQELRAEGDFSLKGTKHLLLYHPDHLDDAQREWIGALKDAELKTARAWAIREYFRWFCRFGWKESDLEPLDVLRALFEQDAKPDRGLVASYLVQPNWQKKYPEALTPSGWEAFKRGTDKSKSRGR